MFSVSTLEEKGEREKEKNEYRAHIIISREINFRPDCASVSSQREIISESLLHDFDCQ